MRFLVNPAVRQGSVPAPAADPGAFHRALPGYRPTPLRDLEALADRLGVGAVLVKDESDRLGLPAFKVLGASWAVERALRARPDARTLVAASAGNHGRAVARVASDRRLGCRVFLPERSLSVRREAIAAEGAEVVVVAGPYEQAVREAASAAAEPGCLLIADVGDSGPAEWVVDGYGTLFEEAHAQGDYDLIVVPAGVGSLAAAAARHAAATGRRVLAVEPVTAACLTASLAKGRPEPVATPGTAMAGLDCAEVSPGAWPSLVSGVHGTVTVDDAQAREAMRRFEAAGLIVGESGAAPLAGLESLVEEADGEPLRRHLGLDSATRVLLVATEGRTGDRGR